MTIFPLLALDRACDLVHYPITRHTSSRKYQQEFVVDADGLVDLIDTLEPTPHVLGRIPDTKLLLDHSGVETIGEFLVLRTMTDETRIELYRIQRADQGRQVFDQGFGHATAAEKRYGNLAR